MILFGFSLFYYYFLILIIEIIRRKPMKIETEAKIQMLGFSILLAISLYVTYNDIVRIIMQ